MKKITLLSAFLFLTISFNAQTYLQENFDTEIPATWTITDQGGATGDSWISGQQGGGNSLNGTNVAIVDSDSNGNGTELIETLTSPAFDTTGATALFLDFEQFYQNIGADFAVVEVFDGANWVEVLNQTATIGAFNAPDEQHIDITAYSNAAMQIRFIYNDGNDWAWYWLVDNVQVYNSTCNFPSGLDAINLTSSTADLSWIPGGTETSWEVINQVAGGPAPTDADSGTITVNIPFQVTGLVEGTNYEFYVRSDCGVDGASIWIGPFNYRISGPGEVCEAAITVSNPLPYVTTDDTSNYTDDYSGAPGTDCGSGFNYLNGDDVIYEYTPTSDTSIDIELSNLTDNYAGVFVYSDCANIGIQCETGAINGFATDDLLIDNFSVTGGQTYYIVISTWAAPQSVGYTLTISENTCIDPVASYAVVGDCLNGQQFFIEVDVTDLGSATSLTISDDQGSAAQSTSIAGTFTFGPYTNATPVIMSVVNDDDSNCTINSEALTQEFCQEFVVDCAVGPESLVYCYEDNGADTPVIFTFTSTDGTPLNLTINSGNVEWNGFANEPYDPIIVFDSDGVTELYNGGGNVGDLAGFSFQSTGDTISFYVASDFTVNCNSSTAISPLDITVSCATCINPSATYQIVDDCDNGDQFLIDVNITDLGDATSLTISNNIDAITVPVTSTGTYQIGPFGFGVDVFVTVSNDQDFNCSILSSAFQLLACPPENDNPCNATIAQVNTDDSCTLLTPGTLLEATDSGIANGTCTGNADDDVWYEFIATSEFQIISILNIAGDGFFFDIDHAVYEGTCDAPIELYCSDADASVTPTLTIGNTYYIRVFSAGGDDENFTFDLCIRPGIGNVSVDQTTYTVEELVIDVLIDSPCAQVSNITFSTGTTYGEENGIGYFSSDEGSFPFDEGLLLTTGDASLAAGPNTNAMSEGSTAWFGDSDLDAAVGIVSNNATVIEFDFVPLNDEISFDFLMASEEYNGSTGGTFECTFSDAFAFLLTDENNVTTNLAVIPGTTTPILVTNIHPENPGCAAINEEFFGGYVPANLPPMSFDGRTEVFTAFSPVNIGETYHIKLVIGDDSNGGFDTALDSGVFLKAGSFDIGEVDLGGDITIEAGNAVCESQSIILDTSAPSVDHVWFKDGFVIEGETASTLVVTEPGLYTTQIIFTATCIISDEVLIEFLPNPAIANTPIDLTACSTTNQAIFDLTENEDVILGGQDPADFTVTYHPSEQDAMDNTNPLTSPYTNVSNPETIYVRIENNTSGCFDTTSFGITISSPSHIAESVDIIGCDNDDDGVASFDLLAHNVNVLNGQDASQFNVTYHATEVDAMAATGALTSPYDSSGETVYVRVETVDFADCYVINSFNLVIGTEPQTTFTDNFDYEVCPNATVPITITATPENYTSNEVTINWYFDGVLIEGENGLVLPVLLAGDYEIEVIFNDTGCSNSTIRTIIELETCVIPQGISPNNDGQNDTFDLSSYDVSKLEIFNRNGTLVYSKTNYTNEWFGQSNDGDELPVGTYFYTMEYQDGKRRSAWIYIQRAN
ncbi:choice-of-anchor L domain-containing protein [uncultured Psychroserpens sp.]|uniref:choice-of-anchor L domain-containing protein n=1 Tax=uncultured Psychroserpens sp. TaxID=255436 RepID=UPI00262DDCFF|nr:choice-of-anchor L domain-containing protein [uncultured Psychroserpens sp.]